MSQFKVQFMAPNGEWFDVQSSGTTVVFPSRKSANHGAISFREAGLLPADTHTRVINVEKKDNDPTDLASLVVKLKERINVLTYERNEAVALKDKYKGEVDGYRAKIAAVSRLLNSTGNELMDGLRKNYP